MILYSIIKRLMRNENKNTVITTRQPKPTSQSFTVIKSTTALYAETHTVFGSQQTEKLIDSGTLFRQ